LLTGEPAVSPEAENRYSINVEQPYSIFFKKPFPSQLGTNVTFLTGTVPFNYIIFSVSFPSSILKQLHFIGLITYLEDLSSISLLSWSVNFFTFLGYVKI